MPRAGVEVLLRRAERHLRPQWPLGLGQRPDQAVVERGVRDRVDDRGAGRQHAVLHPQVRPPADHRVDGPVPAVDRAVVQAQLAELRDVAALEDLGGVVVVGDRQQCWEVADVLLEQVEHGRDPPLAEPHPRPYALGPDLLRAGVGRLFEQRDPGLPPQLPAEQQRRVRAERHLHACDDLGGVPVVGELLRTHLQVELGARARRLRRDRVGGDREPVDAVDADVEILTAGREDLLVEQRVPGVGRQRVGGHVLPAQRRQDADHHHVRADRPRVRLGVVEAGPQATFEVGVLLAGEPARRHVDLDVELAQLGLEVGIGDRAQHLGVAHGRIGLVVDEVELDLHAGERPLELEARLAQHRREHVEAAADLLPIPRPVLAGEVALLDLFAHRAPPFASLNVAYRSAVRQACLNQRRSSSASAAASAAGFSSAMWCPLLIGTPTMSSAQRRQMASGSPYSSS